MGRPKSDKTIEKEAKEEENDATISAVEIFEEMDRNFAGFQMKSSQIQTIDSGSPALNHAMGLSGYPRGRITHIYGPEGAGKSFLAMIAVRNALQDDPKARAVWFDAESSFTSEWAIKFGIWDADPKKSKIRVIKGNKGAEIFERLVGKISKDGFGRPKKTKDGLVDYIKSGALNCPIIVIDSLADIISPREETAPVGGLTYAGLAGFLSSELKRLSALLEETNTALICINQVRQNIDETAQKRNGKYHFPGGENLAHKMSINLLCDKVYAKEGIIYTDPTGKDINTIIGRKTSITIKKSRFGPAPKTCQTTLIFTEGGGYDKIGIGDYEKEIIDIAIKFDLIKGGGAWCTLNYNGKEDKFNGKERLCKFYKENPDELNILHEIVKTLKPSPAMKNIEDIGEANDEDAVEELLENSEE